MMIFRDGSISYIFNFMKIVP